MKRIRLMIGISLISIIIIVGCSIFGIISMDELLKGALLGAVVSIIISVPNEILTYRESRKEKISKIFWDGFVSYNSSLSEIFAFSKDFYYFESIIFEKYAISKDSGDWKDYREAYSDYKEILENRIDSYCNNIFQLCNRTENLIPLLSNLLANIDNKTILYTNSLEYQECYNAYHIIENIDLSVNEAKQLLEDIHFSKKNDLQKKCEELIILRWLSHLLFVDYNRGIEDIEENSASNPVETGKAEKDLNRSLSNIMKYL